MTPLVFLVASYGLLWLGTRVYKAGTWDRRRPLPRRAPADVRADVEAFRAQYLREQYPDVDAQLDDYARRIASLYPTGGEK